MAEAALKLDHYDGEPFEVGMEIKIEDEKEVRYVKCDKMMERVYEKYTSATFDVVLDETLHDDYALGVFVYDDFFDELEVSSRTPYRATLLDTKHARHASAVRFGIDLVPLHEGVALVRALDPIIVNE